MHDRVYHALAVEGKTEAQIKFLCQPLQQMVELGSDPRDSWLQQTEGVSHCLLNSIHWSRESTGGLEESTDWLKDLSTHTLWFTHQVRLLVIEKLGKNPQEKLQKAASRMGCWLTVCLSQSFICLFPSTSQSAQRGLGWMGSEALITLVKRRAHDKILIIPQCLKDNG